MTLEIEVPPDFRPAALKDLEAPPDSIVGAILRGDQAIVPRGADVVGPGDHLIVFATSASADKVRDYFAPPDR